MTKLLSFLAIGVVVIESGVNLIKPSFEALSVNAGRAMWSLCSGDASHSSLIDLVLFKDSCNYDTI